MTARFFFAFSTLLLLLSGAIARGGTTVLSTREIQAPPLCSAIAIRENETSSCQVLDSRFRVRKERFTINGENLRYATYFTDTAFAYHTDTLDHLEDYAIVQWIRGCAFESRFENGVETHLLSIDRDYFGQTVTFRHPHWQIDSDSTDPIYSSWSNAGRFALLRWNRNPASLNPETSTYYATKRPPHSSVFVTDLPAPSFLFHSPSGPDRSAHNATLEFSTCLFRTADLPLVTTPDGLGIDKKKALWCADWEHKFVWDFAHAKMTSPSQIDPICL